MRSQDDFSVIHASPIRRDGARKKVSCGLVRIDLLEYLWASLYNGVGWVRGLLYIR